MLLTPIQSPGSESISGLFFFFVIRSYPNNSKSLSTCVLYACNNNQNLLLTGLNQNLQHWNTQAASFKLLA